MTLDLFQNHPEIEEDKLHPKFKLLRDEPTLNGERKIILNWTDGFIDRDNKIIKEFQTTFHSSFWEFYLFQVFRELSLTIDFTHDRPDFIINEPVEIYIEAVVSNIKEDGPHESQRNLNDILSMSLPPNLQSDFTEFIDESIVRNSNAILSKSKKYQEKYMKLDWVNNESPYIIALSSYDQINYGREYYYSLIALLYGLYFDSQADKFEMKKTITKPGTDSDIPIGLFNSDDHKHISAVIFSCTTTLGKLTSSSISQNNSKLQLNRVINVRNDYEPPFFKFQDVSQTNPEELSDGLFIFYNPNAANKLDKEIFSKTNIFQVTFENRKLAFEGENLPIVSRLNMPKYLFPDIIIKEMNDNFNKVSVKEQNH